MKATWGETSNEELEGEDGENENLALMAKSNTGLDSDPTEVSALALNEGTVLETDSVNVPLEPGKELKNSGGTIPETVVSSAEGIEERTSLNSVLETQNDSSQEFNLRPWKDQNFSSP
ncbi:hypothetical protein HAX54_001252 [Datura stramonium]|uniref:Uncharacterized protein n=1 Tax=Datura stramonium TaxID=4076 RepID=A0ABS8T3B0_DATST|nr:hypothetical protein [Datura stramonium]